MDNVKLRNVFFVSIMQTTEYLHAEYGHVKTVIACLLGYLPQTHIVDTEINYYTYHYKGCQPVSYTHLDVYKRQVLVLLR